jgi:guanidinopropionase
MADFYQRKHPVTGEHYDPKIAVRYSEIPTFMRTPLATDLAEVDIALVGVPFDGGVTNRTGARHGPREIRNQSSLGRDIHHVSRINPYELARVADVGDVRLSTTYDLERSISDIHAFYEALHAHGCVPLSAGGDHAITYPILKAIAAEQPVGLIHVDAHTDTWDEFMGSKFHHGAPFRLANDEGLIDAARTVQIGIRGAQNSEQTWDYSLASGFRVIFMEEFTDLGVGAVIEEVRAIIGAGPVYVSFDVDGLDPVYAPGTGTPEIGGLTTIEAQRLLRGLRGLDIIGGDVVEVSPPFDPSGNTALVGATMMYEILCPMAEAFAVRSAGRTPES